MGEHALKRIGFVMRAEAIHQRGACLVHPEDLDLRALAAELQHHTVECGNRGEVPDMRARHVDDHALDRFAQVEGVGERVVQDRLAKKYDAARVEAACARCRICAPNGPI